MLFNCREFAVAYLRRLSFRIASTALTSLGDVPVPLNRRIGGGWFDSDGEQAVRASIVIHEMSWMLLIFTRRKQAISATEVHCLSNDKRTTEVGQYARFV